MEVVQPQIFQAEWPEGHEPPFPPNTDVIVSIALVIFAAYYSTGLAIFGGITAAVFWTIRKLAAGLIHAAAGPFIADPLPAIGNNLKNFYPPIQMNTPDGVNLDGILSEGSLKKAVIYCQGSGIVYEDVAAEQIFFFQSIGDISVLCFNPRGVGESEGVSSPELLQYDAYTAFKYLISLGYSPEDICMVGYSLGGGYGTMGAALVQEQYPDLEIGAININGFANLPKEVEQVLNHFLQNETIAKIGSILTRIFGWKMNVATAWEALRNPNKTLLCHRQDGMVFFEASLHEGTPDNCGQKICNGVVDGLREMGFHNYSNHDLIEPLKKILRL